MKSRLSITALLLALCVFPCIAVDNEAGRRAELEHDVAEFHQQVEQLEFAQYLARTALLSPEPADHIANASAIQGFLDPSDNDRSSPGLIRWIHDASTNEQLLMAVWPSKREGFLRNHVQIASYLSLASQACEEILRQAESNTGAVLHLQQLYAYLTVALGTIADPFSLAGLADSDALLPTEIRWLVPGDSVKEAVQAIAPNGVIFLNEGEYLVSDVVIDKSIWLARSPFAKKQVRLIGTQELPVLHLQGEGTDIELSHLTITYGRIGVQLSQGVSSYISDCSIRENKATGVAASEAAIATLVDTQIRSNYTNGLSIRDDSKLFLLNCHISFNGFAGSLSPGQGIRIGDQASISIQDSLLVGNRGYGIYANGNASVSILESLIRYHQHSGIHIQQAVRLNMVSNYVALNGYADLSSFNLECFLEQSGMWNPDLAFRGELTGAGNVTYNYDDGPRLCLGDLELPSDFMTVETEEDTPW